MKKFPSLSQWKQIFKVLKRSETIVLGIFIIAGISSFIFLATNFYLQHTNVVPAFGGTYTEGVVGQPRFINPIYGETNDIDRTLIDLTFSGLMTYDNNGNIVKDLAKSYTISSDGKTYDFQLKDNLFWHDGKPLTTDDVIFTIQTIQNSEYKSPLRANWIDIDVQKNSDTSLRFKLKVPYNSFLENCTLKILPKHIWEHISPENFTLSYYNLQPIGSGPFTFESISQADNGFINGLTLQSNRKYYNQPSYITNLAFQFFENKDDLVKAANNGAINGFTLAALDNNEAEAEKKITQGWPQGKKFSVYHFSLPRYFAVFLNNKKGTLFSDENIRKAVLYGVNKDELISKIQEETKNSVLKVDSPILPELFDYHTPSNGYPFDVTQAEKLLDKAGYKDNGSGGRQKAVAKTPAFQFKSYLKVGSKGTEVLQLQSCLAKLDDKFKTMLASETNGTYSKITEDTLTEFQKKYLPELKTTGETGISTREQLNKLCIVQPPSSQALTFTLVTVNQPQLLKVADLLKKYWQTLGMTIEINALSATDIKPIIKNRDYDALLYGEALGAQPDLYPFWYSGQKIDPGLNLSAYENKTVDQLLKDGRETLDEDLKKQKYEQLQDILLNNAPALFLYNPDYVYWVSQSVQGTNTTKIVDPAKRFSNITNWYLKTRRVWK